ncbi:MAG: AMP-binding protein [Algisphaera sp.]
MSLLRQIMLRGLTRSRSIAITDDQRTYSFFQIAAGALFAARAIRKATDRQRVGILLPTSGAFPIALLGCWLARKTPVPLNYLLSQSELDHVVADSDIDLIVTAGKMVEGIKDLGVDLAALPNTPSLLKMEDLKFTGMPPLIWPPKLADDEIAVLLYTSGTSGKPKGVMLTEGNLRCNIDDAIAHAGLRDVDVFLGVLPQFHTFGLTVLTLLPLYMGGSVVYTARFNPRKLVKLIKKHQAQIMVAVPSMYGALMAVKKATPEDFASLKFVISGGEPLPAAIHDGFRDKLGVTILEGYGLTETSPVTNWATPTRNRLHSVGPSFPRVRNVIVDEQDNVLGVDAEGEILICGPSVMKGYHNLPELTAQVMIELDVPGLGRQRCFRTGDIGKVDADGYLFITGRKKEMLIIAGENVFPREIEEVLNRHPDVHASAVIGRADGTRGEVAVAFVELEEDSEFDEKALRQYCRDGMAGFKVPKDIRLLDKLPRNPTGKIQRRELKAD